MLKKMFKLSSPVGIALAVAGVVLALSPEARQATRKMVVKGTAALLGAIDSVKNTVAETGSNHMTEPVSGALTAGGHMLNTAADTVQTGVDATVDATSEIARQTAEGAGQFTSAILDAATEGQDLGSEYH